MDDLRTRRLLEHAEVLAKDVASLAMVATYDVKSGRWVIPVEHAKAFEDLLGVAGHLYASLSNREAA